MAYYRRALDACGILRPLTSLNFFSRIAVCVTVTEAMRQSQDKIHLYIFLQRGTSTVEINLEMFAEYRGHVAVDETIERD